MYQDGGYGSRLLRSWRIPACIMLAPTTYWLIETLAQTGYFRGACILFSLFLSPLIIGAIMRERKIMWGALINGAYLAILYSAFAFRYGWFAAKMSFGEFLVVLAFGLACGACAGGFYDRLSRKYSTAK